MDWWSLETLHITSYVDKDKCAKSEVKQNLERQFDITTTGSSVMNIAPVVKQSHPRTLDLFRTMIIWNNRPKAPDDLSPPTQ